MEIQRLKEAKTAMVVHVPFFASIMFDMMDIHCGKFPHIFPPGNETAATDGKNVWIDEDFFAKLRVEEAVFVMCHEVAHAMWMHMTRGQRYRDLGLHGEPFDPQRWNHACDFIINDMLIKSEVGRMPAVGLHDVRFTYDMLAEDVYAKLKNEKNGGAGAGKEVLDVHILTPGAVTEAEMKRAVQTAANNAKAVGQLPKALDRFTDMMLRPEVKWQDQLRHHVSRNAGRDSTDWRRPHRRRLITQGIYFPSYTGFAAGDIFVVIDTSGSIGDKELQKFLGEVDEICSSCTPSSVIIVGCDSEMGELNHVSEGETLVDNRPKLGGGGGTDFRPPFDFIEKEGLQPATLIYFTDMYGPFPANPPPYPVIWCKTSDVKAPWGIEIRVKIDG